MKKLVIPAILAVVGLVAGFALSSNISSNKVEAFTITACPSGIVQHWDKIVFVPVRSITGTDVVPLIKNKQYDIKVIDDPNTVADLEDKVLRFLFEHGYNVPDPDAPSDSPIEINVQRIKIVDVEYAITCVALAP